MKILLLNYEFPPLGGGAATAAAQISRHMARRGAEVRVLTSGFRGLPWREARDGYVIQRVPVWRRHLDRCTVPEMGTYIAGSAIPALRLAGNFRPDLLHVFFGMPTGPVGLLVHRLRGVPYLLSLRGGDVPGFMGAELARMHALTMPLTKLVWTNAATIVANSQGLHDLAQPTAPDRKIEIVPNGVDTETFQPDLRRRAANGKLRLFFAGRLAGQKGLPFLLAALARLEPQQRAKVEVELAGSGPEEARLKAMVATLGLGATVRFAGWIARGDIVTHYQRADVFVLPSLDEGMPNVMLEAMACGAAILATDIRGNRELVTHDYNGLLVPPADGAALAVALQTLLAAPERVAAMGKASVERAGHYSWAATADSYLTLSALIVKAIGREESVAADAWR